MDDYLPGTSWEIAEYALAAHSLTPELCEEPGLLDMACYDSGDPIVLAGTAHEGLHVMIAPVEWRSAPWLGRLRSGLGDLEAFLFETQEEAAEWARRRISEVVAELAAFDVTLPNWPTETDPRCPSPTSATHTHPSRAQRYPRTASWEIGGKAIALYSEDGFCEHLILLEAAMMAAGTPEVLAGVALEGPQVTITPVDLPSRPWLGSEYWDGDPCHRFLFETRAQAAGWALCRALELTVQFTNELERLQNWPKAFPDALGIG